MNSDFKLPYSHEKKGLMSILADSELAKLGDAYINFVYSLAVSMQKGKPANVRVPGRVMAEALKQSGLRKYLPNRVSRHDQGDAVEALIVYTWLQDIMSLEECVVVLSARADSVEAFTGLLKECAKRLRNVQDP
jgi:hypothetical protein